MGCRRESYEEEPRMWIAKPGDRSSPIGVVAMRAFLLTSDPATVVTQSRTTFARDDGVADVREFLDWIDTQ